MFQLTELQACAPESLPCEYCPADGDLDASVTMHLSFDVDCMGFHTVTLRGKSREAILDCVRNFWGEEDGEWFTEYVAGRITEEEECGCTPLTACSFKHYRLV